MKLAEVLDGYTTIALGAMLLRWDRDLAKVATTKAARIAALDRVLSDPQQVRRAAWTEAERTVLAMLPHVEPRQVGPLASACRARGVENVDAVLEGLLACGALLCPEVLWSEKLDVRTILSRQTFRLFAAPGLPEPPPLSPPAPLRLPVVPAELIREVRPDRGAETAARVMAVAALAGRKKLRVNQDGRVAAATYAALQRELGLGEIAAEWVLRLATSGGVLEVREGVLRPVHLPLAALGLGALLGALHGGLLETASWRDDLDVDDFVPLPGHLPAEGIRDARVLLHGLLARLEPGAWVRVDDLVDAALTIDPVLGFRAGTPPYMGFVPPDRPPSKWAQRSFARGTYLQVAWRLGIVDVGSTGGEWDRLPAYEGDYAYERQFRDETRYAHRGDDRPRWAPPPCDLCVRVTPLGLRVLDLADEASAAGPVAGFHVGTDFEIVAPVAATPPALLFRLDLAARPLPFGPADPVRRWKLEREKWLAALQGGLDGASMLVDLAEALGRPLPENVAVSVAGWAAGYGGVTLLAGHDLVAYADRDARDAAAARLRGVVAVDERWLLVRSGAAEARVRDYRAAPERCLDVAPDGRVTLQPTDDLLVGAELDALTEVTRDGRRLTAARLAGRRAEHVLIWLRDRVRARMPESTEVAIRGWCGEVEARADTVEVLQFATADLAVAVAARPEIAPHVAGLLFGGLLVLKPGSRPTVVRALTTLGITPAEGLAFEAT